MATRARSFRWGSAFLPAARRDDAAVVYAFCRLVDDLADEAEDLEIARQDLDRVRDELQGRATPRPLLAAFLEVVQRRDIDLNAALELIDGVYSDTSSVRVADDAELIRYCYRVAGTVGLMMCGVLGVTAPDARAYAIDLGIAMQLTNICRDVKEDAALGRVYLPATRLEAQGVDPEELPAGTADRARVAATVRELLDLADRYYRSGDAGMHFIPFIPRLAILVAGRIYRAIGVKLRRRGGDALAGRTFVPWSGKLVWLARGLSSALTPRTLGLLPSPAHDPRLHHGLEGLPGADERSLTTALYPSSVRRASSSQSGSMPSK